MVGHVKANEATEAYVRQLFVRRLEDLQSIDIDLETLAMISQRVCEVARLGLVTKSMDAPRGFIMDDGLAHFFAEQILEQGTNATSVFLANTAFVFLLPDKADTSPSTMPRTGTQLDVYYDLRDLMLSLGRPTLVLKRSEYNADKVLSFIEHDVLNPERGQSDNTTN